MNGYASRDFNINNPLCIDDRPHTHGNIVGFINHSRCSLFFASSLFEEHFNDKDFFIKSKVSIFVVVHAIRSWSLGYELLIKYKFCIPPTALYRCLTLGLPLHLPLGSKKKQIE